jgi:hypothetical protein
VCKKPAQELIRDSLFELIVEACLNLQHGGPDVVDLKFLIDSEATVKVSNGAILTWNGHGFEVSKPPH